MGSTFGCLSLNTGTYFGSGYTSSARSGYAGSRVASNVNLNRVTRDITAGYDADIESIGQYLERGDIAGAMVLYNEVFEDVKDTANNYGYELSDSQIASILNNAYKNATGEKYTDVVNQNTHSSFVTGLLEGVPVLGWFFANPYSNAEATAKVTGKQARTIDKVAEGAGSVVGGAASGAAIGAAIGTFGGPIGWVGGAVIGGICGLASSFIKGLIAKD